MTVRKRGRQRKNKWHDGHVEQLWHGWDFLDIAWSDNVKGGLVLGTWEATLKDMRKAYAVLREQVIEGYSTKHPGERPWGWWQFESEQPRDESIPEPEQLERMGLLTDTELAKLCESAHGVRNEYSYPPFRRMWGWWRFQSPHPRDWSISEAEQLCGMWSQLTARERVLMEEQKDIAATVKGQKWGAGIQELTEAELDFLGLHLAGGHNNND